MATAFRCLIATLLAAVIGSLAPHQAIADPEGVMPKVKGFFKEATVPGPEEVLSAYFDAQKSGNFEAAYDLLSTADRAFRSKDLYRADEEKGISGALAQAIVMMAHSLGLTVTAEGVETPAQVAFLEAQGCDRLQGYLLGRPMPPAAVAERLLA